MSKSVVLMPFVVTTGEKKVDPETRKLIRSHVMLGKNLGKSRRTGTKDRKDTKEVKPPEVVSDESTAEQAKPYLSTIPAKVGYELSFTQFADKIEPSNVSIALKFSTIAKQALFPLEACIRFHKKMELWMFPMTYDATYLHAILFSSNAYFEWAAGCPTSVLSKKSALHLSRVLQLLQERLSFGDEPEKTSDSTVLVVLTLAANALVHGDQKIARRHLEGLRKIVNLRGGLATFNYRIKLLLEMLRCDIGLALHTGLPPLFFKDRSWEPFVPYPHQALSLVSTEDNMTGSKYSTDNFPDTLDLRLACACEIMKKFCALMNTAAETRLKLPESTLFDTMASVTYRLLYLKFESGSVDETIRLGLLAFCAHIFLKWQYIAASYPYFADAYKKSLLEPSLASAASPQALLWLLLIGAISVFHKSDEEWLKPLLRQNITLCEVRSWSEMRDISKAFMWIDTVLDRSGKEAFDSVV